MKRWIKDFLLDYSALQKLRRVGQKIKLNRVQKLFQSMMSIVSGIQSGEETSINVLLRTLKKFSVGTVTCTINAAMLSQNGVKTLFFLS